MALPGRKLAPGPSPAMQPAQGLLPTRAPRLHHIQGQQGTGFQPASNPMRLPCSCSGTHVHARHTPSAPATQHGRPCTRASGWSRAPPRPQRALPLCATAEAEGRCSSQLRLTGSCYEDIISTLAQRAITAMQARPPNQKLIIGIAGAPGSGKSTLAAAVKAEINRQLNEDVAVLLPMDGFHYYRRELDAMPNPLEARARRGAHWTFNAGRLVESVARVRGEGAARVPSFDHGVGDPVEDDIEITSEHRIVLVEGLYLLVDLEPWTSLRPLLDDTWFVEVDLDTAMDRVFRRQTSHGVAPEVSQQRIAGNDRPNGELVLTSSSHAAVIVPSSIPFANKNNNQQAKA